jgi:hypothetical protein
MTETRASLFLSPRAALRRCALQMCDALARCTAAIHCDGFLRHQKCNRGIRLSLQRTEISIGIMSTKSGTPDGSTSKPAQFGK